MKIKILHVFLILTFSIFGKNLNAQEYEFSSLMVEDGLSQSVVNCFMQDSYGYLWIGTQNGLNRYDGYSFKKFYHSPTDTTSISDNWIFSVVEDKNQNIWVATKKGLNKFDRKKQTFEKINFQTENTEQSSNEVVYGLFIDNQNNLLINKPPFLHILDIDNQKLEHHKCEITNSSNNNEIYDQAFPIIKTTEGDILLGTSSGLCFFDGNNYQSSVFQVTENQNSTSNNFVTSIFEDKNGKIWVGTKSGLNIFSKKNNSFKNFSNSEAENSLTNNVIYSITQDNMGNYWIGTEGGLQLMQASEDGTYFFQNFNKNQNSLNHDIVLSQIIDKSENLWIGTLNGINKTDLKSKKFQLYRKSEKPNSVDLLDNVIASIYMQNDENIWVGNWGKGLNIYNRQTGKVEHFSSELSGNQKLKNDYVHVIFKNQKGDIWLGTRDGILVYNKSENKFVQFSDFYQSPKSLNLQGETVYSIIESHDKKYWIATKSGVFVLDLKNEKVTNYNSENIDSQKISNNLVYDIIQDKENKIWIATSAGVDIFDPKTSNFSHIVRNPDSLNTLTDNFVVSICEDFEGNIWFGTQTGITKFLKKDSLFINFPNVKSLKDNLVYEILQDKNNNLWFGTQNGLIRYNPQNEEFKAFSLQDGLQSVEFNLNACFLSENGEVFFGGMNGFNSFFPDSLKPNAFKPPLVFTKFEKTNKKGKFLINIYENPEIVLNHSDFAFTIEFSALDFTNPEMNRYAYMMEGVSDEWIDIGTRRFVPFMNLSPGKYVFRVKGTNNDGIWNETGIEIPITVRPPWWRSILAYIIYAVILGIVVILFIKIREKQLIKEKNVLEQNVKERTQVIENQKEKIEKTHSEITASINYASRIQGAMLPSCENLKDLFSEYFIIYKPKDIVSGDFYWIRKINKYIVFAAADCTGHGVPGAFVSMLGISLLNEIIPKKEVTKPNEVLEILRENIKIQLQQTEEDYTSRDGMDIALCIFDTTTNILQYAGANNGIYIVNQATGETNHQKPTKNPIGIYVKERPFANSEIEYQKDDVIYLFSDGYHD